ncbi:hypothetical protein DU508_16975 [Pedobacter chinensis]|uniref:Uncharacterized protein n=1 Tax=Pedobacter chinensis TaxID=2282421 RepID=A0A369PYV2_9SPHI|nr:hypothetical protein DU508_16975 [Pedobacter chinensis]
MIVWNDLLFFGNRPLRYVLNRKGAPWCAFRDPAGIRTFGGNARLCYYIVDFQKWVTDMVTIFFVLI